MGRSGGELLGTVFTDLFQPADGQDERQRSLPFLLMRQSKFDELPLRAAVEGETRWWAISGRPQVDTGGRSEEHTSELQSLMRNSYAVFCLKKTKKYNKTITHNDKHSHIDKMII